MAMPISNVSVVIATLGGGQLSKTIANINSGSLVPIEILICIPEQYSPRVNGIHDSNVRIIKTPFMGQVAQRAEGFRQAKEALVMQLDDDIKVAPDSLEIMTRSLLLLGRGNVVGPVFFNSVTNEPLTKMDGNFRGVVDSLYASLIDGLPWGLRRMGTLSKIGACGCVDPRYCQVELFPTAWLPGGCSISFREDLILESLFPFPGKAYSEDLVHSVLRNRNGIKHHVSTLAKVTIDPPLRGVTMESVFAEVRARRYVANLLEGSTTHATVAAVLNIVKRQIAALLLAIVPKRSNPKRFTSDIET